MFSSSISLFVAHPIPTAFAEARMTFVQSLPFLRRQKLGIIDLRNPQLPAVSDEITREHQRHGNNRAKKSASSRFIDTCNVFITFLEQFFFDPKICHFWTTNFIKPHPIYLVEF